MSIVQWLLLVLLIAVVGGAYWYMRRQAGNDPWQGMDDAPTVGDDSDEAVDRGEALGGDSYIVGVRTLSKNTPASRRAAGKADAPLDDGDYETIGEDGVEAAGGELRLDGALEDSLLLRFVGECVVEDELAFGERLGIGGGTGIWLSDVGGAHKKGLRAFTCAGREEESVRLPGREDLESCRQNELPVFEHAWLVTFRRPDLCVEVL